MSLAEPSTARPRPTRPSLGRGRAAAALLSATAALGAQPSPAEAKTTTPTVTPTCDLTPGATAALTARWRVFYTTRKVKGTIIAACRRQPGPASELLTVGPATQFMHDVQIAGGIVVLTYGDQNGKYNPARVAHQIIDLDGARVATSPAFPYSDAYSATGEAVVRLLDGGALVVWRRPFVEAAKGTTTLSDATQTDRTILESVPTHAAAVPSLTSFAEPGAGIYLAGADGGAMRVASAGPAQIVWATNPAVRRIPNPERVEARPARTQRSLAKLRSGFYIELVRERKRGRVTSWAQLNGTRLARITPTTKPRVIASAEWYTAIEGRWGAAAERSVRVIYTGLGRAQLALERPSPAGGWRPGQLALTSGGAVAVAEPTGVRIWDPAERFIELPGAHDLATSLTGNAPATVFATGADGTAHSFTLGARRGH